MATKEAWGDRGKLLGLFVELQQCLNGYVILAKELNTFKNEVLDDTERKDEMKKLIAEDPDWTIQSIQKKYDEFKAIYDYLIGA